MGYRFASLTLYACLASTLLSAKPARKVPLARSSGPDYRRRRLTFLVYSETYPVLELGAYVGRECARL